MMRLDLVGRLVGLAALLLGPQQASATRSIAACDPTTSECGIAVVSFPTGVGEIVPYGDVGVAVANQGYPDRTAARVVIERIATGMDAPSALAEAVTYALYPEYLNMGAAALHPSSPSGVSVASHLGSALAAELPETCQVLGPTYSVNANYQTTATICQVMAQAFEATVGQPLHRRLYAALVAGSAVGGDVRGDRSAALKIYNGQWWYASANIVSAYAGVSSREHWMPALEWELETYNLYFGSISELVEFTPCMMHEALKVLRYLGYYHGPVGYRWSDEAEAAIRAWTLRQVDWEWPTVVDGNTRKIERTEAYVLMNGLKHDYLIPASPDAR